MSEAQRYLFEPTFNRAVKVRRGDERITSDGGVLLLREADHRLSLLADLAARMTDHRSADRVRYTLAELLRERVFALALGHSAQDDLDCLAHDPAMKAAVWDRPGDHVAAERLASQPTQSRLVDMIAFDKGNIEALRGFLPEPVLRHQRAGGGDRAVMRGTVDIDGVPVETSGGQAGTAYNGYHKKTEYYPLVASFSPEGDYDHSRLGNGFVHGILRKGNAGGAEGALRFILNAVEKAAPLARSIDVRFDAIFAVGKVMDPLTDRGIRFVGRLRSNAVLDRMAAPYLRRPVGRPPKEGYEFIVELGRYGAKSWGHAQRVILVVVDTPEKNGQLKLQPDHFFLVTDWPEEEKETEWVLGHYRNRGTFEDRFGELNQAVGAHLSSPRFGENEATFLLALLSFNLGNILRGEMEKASSTGWDLGRFQRSVLGAGARLVLGGQRLLFDVAAAVAPLWERLVARIERWRWPERWGRPARPRPRRWVAPPAHAHLCVVLRL